MDQSNTAFEKADDHVYPERLVERLRINRGWSHRKIYELAAEIAEISREDLEQRILDIDECVAA